MAEDEARRARERRRRASETYRPDPVRLLLVAEAPPQALNRYFYFDHVTDHDSLFRYVCRAVLGTAPTRKDKPCLLAALREAGVYLVDLSPDPLGAAPLSSFVPDLVERCIAVDPDQIILFKTTVYDTAYRPLVEAGLPVIDQRIPFPGSGQQRRFLDKIALALKAASWT